MSKADKLLKRVEFYEKMASSQKSETSDLLNKASLFERLALYSDRKSFLAAIAQNLTGDIQQNENYIRNAISSLTSSIENWIATKSERQGYLPNNLPGVPQAMASAAQFVKSMNSLGAKFDVDSLQKLLQATRTLGAIANLGNLGDDAKQAWLADVFPKATQLMDLVQKQINSLATFKSEYGPTPNPREMQTFERDIPSQPAGETIELDQIPTPGGRGLPPINPADQEAVFRFAIEEGGLAPNPTKQRADGQIGPETRKALEAVKNYFAKLRPQSTRMTDQEAINAAKFQGR